MPLVLFLCIQAQSAPVPAGVSPANGIAPAETFKVTFVNPDGWQPADVVNILINHVLDGRHACYLAFVPASATAGSLYLVDDAGNAAGPYSGMLLPGGETVQNSQCAIAGAGSSVSIDGSVLTLTLAISFNPSFAGNQVLFLAARNAVSNSDWQPLGVWSVPGTAVNGPAPAGVAPGRTSGVGHSYTFTFTDPNGWQDIAVANILINRAIDGTGACYLAFVPKGPTSGELDLVDDAGNAAGPYATANLPGAGRIANSQCSVDAASSSVAADGNTLRLTLALTFRPGFSGNRVLFLAARSALLNSDWQASGSVGVTAFAEWSGFGRDSRHTAVSPVISQPLTRIRWQTSVDLAPQFTGDDLLIHYGSPLSTSANTIIVSVKTGIIDGVRVEARSGTDGSLRWSRFTDYVLPPHDWIPAFGPALTPSSRLYYPGAGGTVYFRDQPDLASGSEGQLAFFGNASYQQDPQSYNNNVFIVTPITSDADGNIYFGFRVIGDTPQKLASGIARIAANGQGSWVRASTAANDPRMGLVPMNCAPAVNQKLGLVYISVSDGSQGYLLALDASTLQTVARARLTLPGTTEPALLPDISTASPTIGPDDDVYYGVFDGGHNRFRGWLLHFDALLSRSKTPGAFGWDDTASVVPRAMVPSYSGSSAYLLMTKYNDYAGTGGLGRNRLAILDPNASQTESQGVTAMKEVLTILGPTLAGDEEGVKEWCINSAAVDPATRSVLANSEDGRLYRWDLATNTLVESITLTAGIGEAYTPTMLGGDGTVYAINNSVLFAVGR